MAKKVTHRFALMMGAAALALAACSGEEDATTSAETTPAPAQAEEVVEKTQSELFLEMAERHASRYLKANPEQATSLGVETAVAGRAYNAMFGEYGYVANQEAIGMNERFLEQLRRFDRADLEGTALVTYDVLKDAYEMAAQRNTYDFGNASVMVSNGPYVLNQLVGPHIGIPQMMLTEQPLESSSDVQDYITRLGKFGIVFEAVGDALVADANAGVVPPIFALEKVAITANGFIDVPPAEHPLVVKLEGALADIDTMDEDARTSAVAEATELVETVVYPAYTRLAETVTSLVEQSNNDAGIWRIDQGEDFYQHALNSFGANGMTADEVHQLGLDEVARIEAAMDDILVGLGSTEGPVGERFAAIADDPSMVYPNTDEGRAELLAELKAQTDAIMELSPDWFGTLPPQDMLVQRIPVYEQDSAPGGYYTAPSLDGSRPGIYWINLKDTADWPKQTLKTLTYHEAVPGHHFQVALQMDIENFPLIRNTFFYSEFGEGWALYAEEVAAEMGMYEDDPLGDLGRLQSELFRAVRLVVDTGLHAKQWTREEAIVYMVETLGDTEAAVTREVERYAVWPGQATSYKLGMLKIQELREKAESELGEDFDIRTFHDAILLDGAVPLPVLERKINTWIETQKG
ncbi:DUF885 domain-containing protein [Parvularcula flava]|nr:DUF885 domain-containing protein [Aquisalinus luteolus]NHK28343.1 DUF885 domain-containing protein [Aquisalinus luteolus]